MISPHPRRAHLQEGPIPLSQPCWSLRNWRDSPWPSTNLSVAEGLTCFLLVLTVFTVSLLTCWLSSCLFCLPLTGTGRRMPTSHPLCCAMVGVILVVWPLCVQSFWFYETGNRSNSTLLEFSCRQPSTVGESMSPWRSGFLSVFEVLYPLCFTSRIPVWAAGTGKQRQDSNRSYSSRRDRWGKGNARGMQSLVTVSR